MSNVDYSPSSVSSDIPSDPGSPPSPASSCLHPSSDDQVIHLSLVEGDRVLSGSNVESSRAGGEVGYNASSPPSCHGSYDSGLEETIASSSTDSPQVLAINSPQAAEVDGDPDHRDHQIQLQMRSNMDGECSPCSIVAADINSDSCSLSTLCIDVGGSVCHDWLVSQDSKTSSICDDEVQPQPQPPPPSHKPCFFATPFDYIPQTKTMAMVASIGRQKQWNRQPQQQQKPNKDVATMGSRVAHCQPHVFRQLSTKFASSVDRNLRNCSERASVIDPFLRCHWLNCGKVLPCGGDIVDHIRSTHVDAQVNAESFVCQWEGCKVYNRSSCSLSWLERHVLAHSGNKPFKCIVEGCGQRFTSQTMLERHVNSHFNQPQHSSANQSSVSKRKDDTPTKILKRRKLRYRRTAWMARKDDFFDSGVMECVRHQLLMNTKDTPLDLENYGSNITFHSTVIGTQVEKTGKVQVLLHWIPENLIPDEWVNESQVQARAKHTLPISNLPLDALLKLDPTSRSILSRHHRKNRRK